MSLATMVQKDPLTNREVDVMRLVAMGYSNKLIAAALGISDHTAKFHVNNAVAKLGVGPGAGTRTLAAVVFMHLGDTIAISDNRGFRNDLGSVAS